jgi:hypothetical protein
MTHYIPLHNYCAICCQENTHTHQKEDSEYTGNDVRD